MIFGQPPKIPDPMSDEMTKAVYGRRTRILALDAASKVAAGLAVNHATTDSASVSQFTIDIARRLEAYLDGDD